MQTFDSTNTGASVRMPASSPIQTWSPIVSRRGNQMFTFARITTPRPIFVPQEIFLIDDTIARNIALGVPDNEVDTVRLREVCAMAQILDFIELELRDGFQTTVGERGVRLSGGERQRLGLARALYHRPSLVLLDEATSALDIATEAKLLEAFRALAGKLTIVMVAHRLSALANCDKLLDLGKMRVAANVSRRHDFVER